ncbi:hypothetical protein [Metabacillus arenae]|uniref:Uncharacterized protein n=1 Tax=Metabacillus arenae TaxID=2771434 RepID=A0A926S0G7_9BACI|nr:hypothetical protein [Metabacillus arenae]MBD1383282.1 hypothetical protein [Metabacillus arenae]
MHLKTTKLEALFWSIALPGFGQYLNGHLFKGTVFIFLEILINCFSHFNQVIMYSFLGEIEKATVVAEYQWLMFYPCVYMFAMYDAYKHASGDTPALSFLPFAFGAYFVTVGLMYSPVFNLNGHYLGPVWLPMISLVPGLIAGFLIRAFLIKRTK